MAAGCKQITEMKAGFKLITRFLGDVLMRIVERTDGRTDVSLSRGKMEAGNVS
jgi:hypothetical protein